MAQLDPENDSPEALTSRDASAGGSGPSGTPGQAGATEPSGRSVAAAFTDVTAVTDEPYAGDAGSDDSYDAFYDEVQDEDGEPVETVDELGRRHLRRAAPEGTAELLENEAPRRTGLPDKLERWRVRSATGSVLTAVAFGLQQVFEPERKEPAIVMETSGDPPRDLPVEAQLEQLGPRQSSVKVRRWLLDDKTTDGPSTTPTSQAVPGSGAGQAGADAP